MNQPATYIGDQNLYNSDNKKVEGLLVTIGEERFFKVENYDAMPPFLMSIVSDSDHWMFISSSGGVTAGRKNPDNAIFPYYTDDKIHESAESTGSKCIIRVSGDERILVWEPFSENYNGLYNCTKNLYKNIPGNKLLFEEINHDLHLTARIQWMNSDTFGWVRKTSIVNNSATVQKISMLDGIRNILPWGLLKNVQEQFSTLMDAYKKSELDDNSLLAIFSMSSIPVDRAEPSEALRATTVWCSSEQLKEVLLSSEQLQKFRLSGTVTSEKEKKGTRGAYFISKETVLEPGEEDSHLIIAEVAQDSTSVQNLSTYLNSGKNLEEEVLRSVEAGTRNLEEMVFRADGKMNGGNERSVSRHFSNVLFNIMRGGIYDREYTIARPGLEDHFQKFNKKRAGEYAEWIKGLSENEAYPALVKKAAVSGDPDLFRIVLEYLPLTFSRRHGDPSRPWNRFSIDVKNPDGSRSLSYEGNWRDIFQNWEALSYSYPSFLQGIIAKFLNASTIDGYNPYRITNEGIDWEVFDPQDPWSFIGYWGDHQVIYLLKLLELHEKYFPGELNQLLNNQSYVFANVPYRIKPYQEIIRDPNKTIIFDEQVHKEAMQKAAEVGADGKLLTDLNGKLKHVNLLEKLLIPLLTKLSNFIPGAGIWLNTQRPEWNDANNALVGNGVSMVTLYYLRRFVTFFTGMISESNENEFQLSGETATFLQNIVRILAGSEDLLSNPVSDQKRKKITDSLGMAGSEYREKVYNKTESGNVITSWEQLLDFTALSLRYIDHTISLNRREDNLYHAYNLIEITDDAISIKRLPVMLEGQVAILSSGFADANEVADILQSLRESRLYREDQQSYMLYPDRQLPHFKVKNNIPEGASVLSKLLAGGGYEIVSRDDSGNIHFNGDFKNGEILKERVRSVNERDNISIEPHEEKELLELYEEVFNHHAFTGRSGSFFKYEGLGSIYWHMVSKLLVAVGENIQRSMDQGAGQGLISRLHSFYTAIKKGIGANKNPADYGAIPTDPYSHTPSMLGAQQPGMTGQVKEDIISRWFELGLQVNGGMIRINRALLRKNETGKQGELSFTFCGVPFTFLPGKVSRMILLTDENKELSCPSDTIEAQYSREIFTRSGKVKEVRVLYND